MTPLAVLCLACWVGRISRNQAALRAALLPNEQFPRFLLNLTDFIIVKDFTSWVACSVPLLCVMALAAASKRVLGGLSNVRMFSALAELDASNLVIEKTNNPKVGARWLSLL